MNKPDEILDELWTSRRKIEEEHCHNLDNIYQSYLQKQNRNPEDYYMGTPVILKKSKAA